MREITPLFYGVAHKVLHASLLTDVSVATAVDLVYPLPREILEGVYYMPDTGAYAVVMQNPGETTSPAPISEDTNRQRLLVSRLGDNAIYTFV